MVIAIIIDSIPKTFPLLELSGPDKPFKDKINNIEETIYAMAEKLSIVICFPFFKHCKHSPCNYKTSKYIY